MLNASSLVVQGTATAADIDHVTLHNAQPDNTGSNLTTAPAQAMSFTCSNAAVITSNAAATFTAAGGVTGGAVTHVGLWHGVPGSGGVFRGWEAISGDASFNSQSQYVLDSITLTGTAPS